MQGIAAGSASIWVWIAIVPFLIVIFKPKWLKNYFLWFCSIWIVAIIGMILFGSQLIRENNYWWDLFCLLSPFLSFLFWWLVSKFVRRK